VARPARQGSTIAILAIWLAGWGAGEWAAARQLLSGTSPEGAGTFLALWLTAWTLGGALAFGSFLWSVAGREVLAIEGPTLTVRREALGLGRTRSFELGAIRALRAVQPGQPEPGEEAPAAGRAARRAGSRLSRRGTIAFEADGQVHRLGLGLDPGGPDVAAVLEALRRAGVDRTPLSFR
jgi:hypothetical protein